MNASGVRHNRNGVVNDRTNGEVAHVDDERSLRRVLSVSAHDRLSPEENRTNAMPSPAASSNDVFLSPRVIDEQALADIRQSLREAVDLARTERDRLGSVVEESRSHTGAAADASKQLQERLSIGARLLKAFQAQLDAGEDMLEQIRGQEGRLSELNNAIELRMRAFESRLDATVERFESRTRDLTNEALNRFDAHVAASESRITSIDGRLADAERGVVPLLARVDTARTSIANAVSGADRVARDVREAVQTAKIVIDQTALSRQMLSEDLLDASTKLDEAEQRSGALRHQAAGALAEVTATLRRLASCAAAALDEDTKGTVEEGIPRADEQAGQQSTVEPKLNGHARFDQEPAVPDAGSNATPLST